MLASFQREVRKWRKVLREKAYLKILSNNMHVRTSMLNTYLGCLYGGVVTTSIFPQWVIQTGNKKKKKKKKKKNLLKKFKTKTKKKKKKKRKKSNQFNYLRYIVLLILLLYKGSIKYINFVIILSEGI